MRYFLAICRTTTLKLLSMQPHSLSHYKYLSRFLSSFLLLIPPPPPHTQRLQMDPQSSNLEVELWQVGEETGRVCKCLRPPIDSDTAVINTIRPFRWDASQSFQAVKPLNVSSGLLALIEYAAPKTTCGGKVSLNSSLWMYLWFNIGLDGRQLGHGP